MTKTQKYRLIGTEITRKNKFIMKEKLIGLCIRKDGLDVLFPILPTKHTKSTDVIYKTNKIILQGGEKKAEWL